MTHERTDGAQAPVVAGRSLALGFVLLALTLAAPSARAALVYAGHAGIGPRAVDRDRLESIERGIAILRGRRDGRALVGGNLSSALVERDHIYHVGMVRRAGAVEAYNAGRLRGFKYVFVEKNPEGDTAWPLTQADYRTRIEGWRASPGTRVILDDDYVFLAEGSFADELGPW